MRLQKEKEKKLKSAQGSCHRLSGTVQDRSNPDVHTQDVGQTTQNKRTDWITGELQGGKGEELHMGLWDKNQDLWKEGKQNKTKTQREEMCVLSASVHLGREQQREHT